MPLDIRVPIGAMLGLMGLLLAGYGLFGDQAIYERSLGLNINLIWGSVLVVAAAVLLFLGTRKGRH
jgi:uncharacterized membrane protein